MENSTLSMNLMKSVKYGLSPEDIERQSLTNKRFRIHSNMRRIMLA